MQSLDGSSRVNEGMKALFFVGYAICSTLVWLLFTSALYGRPATAAVPAGPAAPSGLTATAVSSSKINLVWADSANNEDGFKIERKTGAAGAYVQIATVGADVTNFSNISGLSPNTEYFYRVRAYDATGHSAFSNEASAVTLQSTPTAPGGLTANAVSNTRINLAWTDNSNNDDGFKIEIKGGPSGTYTEIAAVGANVTSYSSTGLEASSQYFYRVRAYNTVGHSAYSNEANVTTLPDPPAAPGGLTAATVSNTQINLTWEDNSGNETGFKIERKLGSAVTYTEIATVSANVTSYSSTGLAIDTAYNYRVRAYNAGGNSGYSNVASATTLPNPPTAPSSLTATTVSNSQIDLAWQDNANNELGHILERKTGVSGTYAVIDTVSANVTTYSSLGLTGSTQYFYRVRAYNAGGNSAYSNATNATTKTDPPVAPGNLTATAISNNQINLTWTDNATNEGGFKIERKIPQGMADTYAEIATVSANAVSYSSKGLDASTEYFYRVRAFNLTGSSSYSNEANATTLPDPPTAPSGLQAAAVSNIQINLTWTDNAANEAGFKIERKLSSAATYTQIAMVGANVTTYLNTGLSPNTAYSYRVRAYNPDGHSGFSNADSATTLPNPPAAPGGLVATTVSKNQINLVWADSSNDENGFKIERKLNSAVTYTEIATVGANVTSYSSMSLNPNTAYSYRVRAYNTGGNSAYSNVADATTLPNPPNAPSGLSAIAVSNKRIDLTWQDNATNELGFFIERKTGAGGAYAVIDTVSANVKIYSSLGLAASTEYFYQVRAFNAGGYSVYSNAANATTQIDPPAAPGGLAATAVSNNQINLAWTDNAGNEDGFNIELKISAPGTYTQIATVAANATSYSSTGLDAGTLYFYRVRAFNSTGNSSYSNEAQTATLPDPPTAPSSLLATAVSNTQINLKWTNNSTNEDSFKIERKLSLAATYTQIAMAGANVTSYSDTGLTPNAAYSYRVRAFNTSGNSAYSNVASATTFPNPPAAPGSLTATGGKGQINLVWADSANNEDGFKIERKASAAGTFGQIATVGANVTSYSNTGLGTNSTYHYRVRAYNMGGHSAYSSEANATTLPNLPKAPGNLTANAISSSQIDLAWADSSNNEDGFKIERRLSTEAAYTEIATVGAEVMSFSNTGLTANSQYFYRVRAFNAGGNSAYSNAANATTQIAPPAAPGSLTVTGSKGQINLVWADSSNNEAGFKIERKASAAGTFGQIATVSANVTSYSNTGLGANATYHYRVRAYNAGGHSAYSNEANATTLPPLPKAPGNLIANAISSSQIDVAWADSSNNEDGFKIERKTGVAGTYAEIATAGANVTSFSNTGLTANSQYFYRVRAFNAGGHSAYSNAANATTLLNPPAAPDSLTATAASNSQINLAWMDNADDEAGFKIERKTGVAGTYAEIATAGANVTSFSNTGLTANSKYFYRVRAFNAGGHSVYSNAANATTPIPPLVAPSSLTANAVSKNQIDLVWADSANNEDGFKIERKASAAGTFGQIATVGANVTSYSNTGLGANSMYHYRVRAYSASGHSAYSNEANATTLPPLPKAPDNLIANAISSSQIDLVWADSSNNEDGFKIERKTGIAGTYAEIATVGADTASFSSTGLTANSQYFYRVRAFNASGHSAYSNAANATTLLGPPAAPDSLTATAVSNSQINLAWMDNADTEAGFKIERKTGVAGTYAEIATVGANVTSFSNSGLAANSKYFYRVRAFNAGGHSAYSNAANATTPIPPLVAPSSLTANAVSKNQIDLVWADNSNNEEGFKIERKATAGGTFGLIATVGANVTSYSNTGLGANGTYYYRVRAYNAGGHSAYSNEANATTLPNPPKAPGNLIANAISSSQIDLAWADSSNNEDGFKIERKLSTEAMYSEIVTAGANVTSFSNTGLTANSQYFYRVRAFNAGGNSAYSSAANATTLLNPPAAPDSLTATTASSNKIDLAWTDNSNNEVGFKIERKTGAAGAYVQIATAGANVTNFANTGLSPNTQYFYRVRAHNTGGHSAYSNEANATTLPNAPKAPGSLSATTVSQTKINLAWADSSNNESGFKIERKTGAAGTYAQIAAAGANVTSYADSSLTASTAYFYRVRAHNAGGHSAYSNEANGTTLPNPPAAPSSLTATTSGSSQINLAWTDNSNNESGFKIERKTGAAGTYAAIDTVGANITSYSSTSLDPSTAYFYRVRAFNTAGNSAYSNEANATTLSGGNLALNKPATASHTDSSSTPTRGVDGDSLTFWRSGFVNGANPIAWLQVELVPSSSIPVGRAVVTWYQNYFADEYDFQVSTDGTNWTTVYTNNAGAIGTQDFTFTTAMARFVRLYLKKNAKANYRVAELEVYAGSLTKDANSGAETAIIPEVVTLAQNYPNPFNPATTISYALPEGMHITLKILNVAGQEVKTLAEGYQGRGVYRISFNASRLPSGVYFAVLKAGATVQMRRMILTK